MTKNTRAAMAIAGLAVAGLDHGHLSPRTPAGTGGGRPDRRCLLIRDTHAHRHSARLARHRGVRHRGVRHRGVRHLRVPARLERCLLASVMTRPDTQTAAVALQVFGATQEGGGIPIYGQMMAALLPRSARTGGGGRSGVPVLHRPARWGPTWPRGTRRRATPAGPRRTDRGPSAASDPRERVPLASVSYTHLRAHETR